MSYHNTINIEFLLTKAANIFLLLFFIFTVSLLLTVVITVNYSKNNYKELPLNKPYSLTPKYILIDITQ